jgi:hypothetical protein
VTFVIDRDRRVAVGLRHMPVQWVHLERGRVLVASDREAWIQRQALGTIGFGRPMTDSVRGTRATTRQLLDGAIAVAELEARADAPPPMTDKRWAWSLANQWYCAHHSVALLPRAIERFEADGRDDLAGFGRRKLAEEVGHDEFPLNDLEELGYDAAAAVELLVPAPSVTAALEHARGSLTGPEPIAFLGYVYALERQVLRLSEAWFDALRDVLGPGVDAATGVRAHATELDGDHIAEAIAFIARLPAQDRATIARAVFRITEIYAEPFEQPSEAELAGWLSRARRERLRPLAEQR